MRAAIVLAVSFLVLLIGGGARFAIGLTFKPMAHQICGGIGAYAGAAIFDATGGYQAAFLAMMISALVALALTLLLRRPVRA